MRGCGSKVTTVPASPVLIAASTTAWCPRCTPSNVPIAAARGWRSTCAGACAILIVSVERRPDRDPRQCLLRVDDPLGIGLVDGERADLEPAQRPAVAAERVGDRAHVGSRRDTQVQRHDTRRVREQIERLDPRAPHRHLDLHTLAVEAVRALAADLHRRRRRDPQLDVAAEAVERTVELARARRRVLVDDVSLRVAGRRSSRQVDLGEVALVERRRTGAQAASPDRRGGRASRLRTGRASPCAPYARPCDCARPRRRRATTVPPACRRGSPRPAPAPW